MRIADHLLFVFTIVTALFTIYGVFWKKWPTEATFDTMRHYPFFSIFTPKSYAGYLLFWRILAIVLLLSSVGGYLLLVRRIYFGAQP